MNKRYFIRLLLVIYLIASFPPSGQVMAASSENEQAAAHHTGRQQKEREKEKDAEKEADLEGAQSVMWKNPTDIAKRNLFYGIGGARGAPDPTARFVFVRRDTSGSKEKIQVEDDQNRKWTVKFGSEARPEVTATRIVWAVGFHVDQDYFVKRAHIHGREELDVEDVRFERDDDQYETVDRWSWTSNPFVGTRELDGLKVLMALLNNYDLKTENNKIVRPDNKLGGKGEKLTYYVNDLGATLRSTGTWLTQLPLLGQLSMGTKGTAEDFAEHRFITGISNGEVIFHYKRRSAVSALEGVKVENAKWMGNLLSRLSEKQLRDAFRAGGFDNREITIFVRTIRDRIRQLRALKSSKLK